MKAYPKYKDSSILWLNKLPKHWNTIKTKYLFKERVEKGCPEEPLLAATQTKGVVPKTLYENRTVVAQKDLHLLKLVEVGDFVISLRSFQGGIEYAYYRGIISPAYTVMIPSGRLHSDYFKYLAKSKEFISMLQTCVTGIREGQNINYEILKRTPLPIPQLSEQQQIARYLDWQTAKINKFIKGKKKLIALLKEQKQSIINEVVTKGINPDVKMKDSGAEWIGEIPEHWEVRRAKYLFKQEDIRSETGKEELLSVSHLTGVTPRSQKSINMFLAENYIGSKICKLGFIAVNTMWAWMAAIGVSKHEGVISSSYHTYSQKKKTYDEVFLDIFLRSTPMKSTYTVNSSGITSSRMRLYPDDFLRLCFVFPSIAEQKNIVEYLEKETTLIDKAISRAEREIELIQEYRTRLVSDVVTGKVDVRSVKVPDFEPIEVEDEILDSDGKEDELTAEELD